MTSQSSMPPVVVPPSLEPESLPESLPLELPPLVVDPVAMPVVLVSSGGLAVVLSATGGVVSVVPDVVPPSEEPPAVPLVSSPGHPARDRAAPIIATRDNAVKSNLLINVIFMFPFPWGTKGKSSNDTRAARA